MALGVTGAVKYFYFPASPTKGFTAADLLADAGNMVSFSLGAIDNAAELLLQRQIALDMIAMVMGVEDMGELPATSFELALDRGGIGGVDRGGGATFVIMNQETVIVGPADELMHFEMGHGTC